MRAPLPAATPPGPLPPPPEPAALAAPPRRAAHGLRDVVKAMAIIWGLDLLFFGSLAVATALRPGGKIDDSVGLRFAPVDAVITLGVCWLFACRKYRRPFRDGFGLSSARPRTVLAAGLAGALAALFYGQLAVRGIGNTPTPMSEWVGKIVSTPNGFLFLLVTFPAIAAVEELYYRGFIFPALAERWGLLVAAAVTAAWFGLLHLPQLQGNWVAFSYVVSMGIFFTLLRARTGSTAPGLTAHVAYNTTLLLGGLLFG
ncbi:MAG TPA: CPBP family intramembrane glutamic endopeptidase [Polyangiaceae bacterium]|nr:CPBP family intramembrane glutamic endopeptidase [Polyangiaceae bacterium]